MFLLKSPLRGATAGQYGVGKGHKDPCRSSRGVFALLERSLVRRTGGKGGDGDIRGKGSIGGNLRHEGNRRQGRKG